MAASAWLHSTPEAVSEAPQSLPPFTARDGALKSGGFSRRTLLTRGSLATLSPSRGALKSGGLSLATLSKARGDLTTLSATDS